MTKRGRGWTWGVRGGASSSSCAAARIFPRAHGYPAEGSNASFLVEPEDLVEGITYPPDVGDPQAAPIQSWCNNAPDQTWDPDRTILIQTEVRVRSWRERDDGIPESARSRFFDADELEVMALDLLERATCETKIGSVPGWIQSPELRDWRFLAQLDSSCSGSTLRYLDLTTSVARFSSARRAESTGGSSPAHGGMMGRVRYTRTQIAVLSTIRSGSATAQTTAMAGRATSSFSRNPWSSPRARSSGNATEMLGEGGTLIVRWERIREHHPAPSPLERTEEQRRNQRHGVWCLQAGDRRTRGEFRGGSIRSNAQRSGSPMTAPFETSEF
jgi:hypothetical protein